MQSTHFCSSRPQNHVNLVHRKGKTKVCPHPGCGKKFYLSNHLRRHMIIHSGQALPAGAMGRGLEARAGAGRDKPWHLPGMEEHARDPSTVEVEERES